MIQRAPPPAIIVQNIIDLTVFPTVMLLQEKVVFLGLKDLIVIFAQLLAVLLHRLQKTSTVKLMIVVI